MYLQSLHDTEKKSIVEKYTAERAVLEAKYAKLYNSVYDKRLKVLVGDCDKEIDEEFLKQDPTAEIDEEEEKKMPVKGCPQFWVTALSQCEAISEILTEADVDALEYLSDIRSVDLPNGAGFTLTFFFAENPFFENTTLSKTYSIPNLYMDDEPMLEKITGTAIKWKPDKCLTHKTTTKKQRSKSGKNKGQIRTVTKSVKVDSFFNFFADVNVPSDDDTVNSEEADLIEGIIDQDYDIACSFRSNVIPDAIEWFTGEANGDDEDEDDEGWEEGDSDDDDDVFDEDDSEDDDEDNDDAPKQSKARKEAAAKRGGSGAAGKGGAPPPPGGFNFGAPPPPSGGAAGDNPNPECKQN